MSREYQRLHEEVTAVDWEIQELQESCRVRSAAELATLERRLDCLTVKRASLTKAIILLSSVEHPTSARCGKFSKKRPQNVVFPPRLEPFVPERGLFHGDYPCVQTITTPLRIARRAALIITFNTHV